MRTLLLVTALFTLFSANAAFARNVTLLRKQQASGFVAPPYASALDCNVLADKVVITRSVGGVVYTTTRPITIDHGVVMNLTAIAKKAKIQESRGPVDGPSTKYEGFLILPTDGLEPVLLFSMNGGNGTVQTNASPEATVLKRLLDSICD
jgi:hypothetical protein